LTRSCGATTWCAHESAITDIKALGKLSQRHSPSIAELIFVLMSNWRLRLEPVITPLFRVWWRLSRPMTLGARTIVRDLEGRILLVRHSYSKGWHLPGGGVEIGETSMEAALRELVEEGGVEAIGAPKLFGLYANQAHFPNDHVAIYVVDTWRTCAPRAGPEIAERGFFARDALPEGVTPGTRRRLAELFDGAKISATW
jgi:ADP-ribose pyrophosphatase YjhB (NUDIX family)